MPLLRFLVTALAWTCAIATVVTQRLLWPLLTILYSYLPASIRQPQQKTLLQVVHPTWQSVRPLFVQNRTAEDYMRLTRRELQEIAGTRRNISKQQLVNLILAS